MTMIYFIQNSKFIFSLFLEVKIRQDNDEDKYLFRHALFRHKFWELKKKNLRPIQFFSD